MRGANSGKTPGNDLAALGYEALQQANVAVRDGIDLLGADRVIYSIDAPYEKIEEAQAWWKSLESVLDEDTQRKIGRENAIKLLNLPLK